MQHRVGWWFYVEVTGNDFTTERARQVYRRLLELMEYSCCVRAALTVLLQTNPVDHL